MAAYSAMINVMISLITRKCKRKQRMIRQNQLRKKIAVITGMEVGEKWFRVR